MDKLVIEFDTEKRLARIEKMCTEILVKVNRLDIEPLRKALNECDSPEEAKALIEAYCEL